MKNNRDFLVVWTNENSPKLAKLAEGAEVYRKVGHRVHLYAWPVADGATSKEVPKNILCGTPVSGIRGKSHEELIAAGQYSDLTGAYAVVTPIGFDGLWIVNDPFGLQPLFLYRSESLQICSTRADLAALAASMLNRKPVQFNRNCIINMMALAQTEGNSTAFRGVKISQYGHAFEMDQKGFRSIQYWPIGWRENRLSQQDVNDKLDKIIEKQTAAIANLVKRSKDPLEIDLTGGKDSRAMLALCINAGVQNEVIFLTQGEEYFPDAIIASNIAHELDLNYILTGWLPPRRNWYDESKVRALEGFGRRGCFEEVESKIGETWRLQGFLGESWRTHFPNRNPPLRETVAVRRHIARFQNRSRYFKDGVFEKEMEKSTNFLREKLAKGINLEDIADVFHLSPWQRGLFSGRPRSLDRVMFPLYSRDANALSFSLTTEQRRSGYLIQEIGIRCGLELKVPYTKQLEDDPNLNLKFKRSDKQIKLQSEIDHWNYLRSEPGFQPASLDRTDLFKEVLLSEPNHEIFSYVNFNEIETALSKPIGLNLKLARLLSEILAGKIWMSYFQELLVLRASQLEGLV